MIYLIDISRGLTGIIFVVAYFIFILGMTLYVKPLQKLFKITKDTEAIIWFSVLVIFGIITILTN